MKIFKISQTKNNGYGTYDSAVVVAENEEEASKMNPGSRDWSDRYSGWCSSHEQVIVEYLGEADYSQEVGFICKSFNAG